MALKYKHLLSPIEIGNVVLRNLIIATAGSPRFIQGPETFPTEGYITHYANKAKNGAAVVVCKGNQPVLSEDDHVSNLDIFKGPNQHYFDHVIAATGSSAIVPEVPGADGPNVISASEALVFFDGADRFAMVGDCDKVGNIQTAVRSAFSSASLV